MAFKFQKNKKNNRLVKDERIVDHPSGGGLVKKTGKVDNLLINRRGLINGPPVQKQDPGIGKTMDSSGKGKARRALLSLK